MKRAIPLLTVLVCAGYVVAMAAAARSKGNEDVIKKYIELWNTGDLTVANQILTTDVVRLGPAAEYTAFGIGVLKAHIADTLDQYKSFKVSINDLEGGGIRHEFKAFQAAGYIAGSMGDQSVASKLEQAGVYQAVRGLE